MGSLPKKIILVSIDTLRADHLGCYGYYRDTSPVIDELAESSLVFRNALSPISYTAPSFASLFTSKYPSYHHVEFSNGRYDFPVEINGMLQQILRMNGFATGAFVSTPVLSAKRTRLDEGFDIYDDEANTPRREKINRYLFRRAEETLERALGWLRKKHQGDFFLWIHFMDVHGPYSPPDSHRDLFVDDPYWSVEPIYLSKTPAYNDTYREVVPDGYVPGIPGYQLLFRNGTNAAGRSDYERNVDYYIARYDASIRYIDDQVEKLIEALRALRIFDDSTVIIHSDHGEAFGENGLYFDHGATLSLDQIHVPLVVKLPGEPRGIRRDAVSLLDVTPSILDYFEIRGEGYDFHGVPILRGAPTMEREIYSQFLRQVSWIRDGRQVLYGRGWFETKLGVMFGEGADERWLRYEGEKKVGTVYPSMRSEPRETVGSAELIERARSSIVEFIKGANSRAVLSRVEGEVSQEERDEIAERLAALGYLE